MSSRAIRRAAERAAAKLQRQAARDLAANTTNPAVPPPAVEEQQPQPAAMPSLTDEEQLAEQTLEAIAAMASKTEQVSEARLAANRENAKKSTGPQSATAKAKVRLNALKTGLTAQIVVMPHENAAEYKQYLDRRFKKFLPVGDDETITVQSIVDNEWRLARIAPLEEGVFTLGHRLFADEFADEENPATRAALIRVKTMQEYRRDLSNLALQERRLRNHIEKDLAKLEELQKNRFMKRTSQVEFCQKQLSKEGSDFQPSDIGIDFSTSELQAYLNQTDKQFRLNGRRPDFDLFLAAHREGQKRAAAA